MKKLLLAFLIFSTSISLYAQPNDCCTAEQLTSNATFNTCCLGGPGYPEIVSACSCLEEDEHNSYWFQFDALAFSTLEFIIRPEGSGAADFDFALFLGGCPCGQGSTNPPITVTCDFTSAMGPTGVGDPSQWGIQGNPPGFVPAVQMGQGQTYFLVIDNKGSTDGFTLEFSPGSQIGQLPKPGPGPLAGPSEVCVGGIGSFSVPNEPGTNYIWTVDHWYFPPAGITNEFNYSFPFAGSYEVCVQTVIGGCYESDPNCITVDVGPLAVGEEFGTVCFPEPYIAANGEAYYSSGVYILHLQSYQGCDSTSILTVEAFSPDLEIRSETFCAGDCVDFEGEMLCDPGTYEKIYENQHGCDSIISLVLIEVPLEIKVLGADTLDCNLTSLLLDASMSLVGGPSTYIWTNVAGDTLDTDSILFVNAPGIYTIEVTTTVGDDTCVDEKDITIIADTAPPAGVTATGDTISCTTASIVLMGNATTPNVTYTWTGPNGFFSNEQNPTAFAAGIYTLTVTGENGCITVANAEVVEITEVLTANATGGTINCYSSSVTLNGTSPDPGVNNYNWAGPNSTTYSGQNPTVNLAGNYVLTVTDVNGCTGTAQTSVSQDITTPQANASANQVLTCNTTSVFLNGNGSSFGPQFSYLWTTANGNITAGANTLNPTVNEPGTYTLTVTNNNNGCTQTAQAEVQELPTVTAGISGQTNVLCFGENNGSAMASGNGGNGLFTYTWSNGMTGNMVTGLSEGSYVVTISDGNNCTATASVTITQPSVLSANATATSQTMSGANDGTATANPSGGTPGYTYLWNTGTTTSTIDGLAPGNYTVTVTDDNGCESVQTVTVNEIECLLTANISQENISCNGLNDGSATATLDNALEPFSFVWSNDETTQTINGLSPGSYSVTATDANGCEVVASVTINEPSALNVNATATDQVIPGLDDGTASANPTGGTNPYTYEWNNGETTVTITGLAPGDYEVIVTDANGCQQSQTVTVDQYNCGVLLDINVSDVSCNGLSDGQATALPAGGLAPFTFEWSNGETTPTIGNLPAGTYDVIVLDAGNCPAAGQVIVSEPPLLVLEATDATPAACGSDNGTATVLADGGTPDYEYLWPNGETTQTVENLAEGTYTVVVTDAKDCMTTLDVEIETDLTTDIEPPVAIATDFTVELGQDGTATVAVSDVDNGSYDNCEIATIELDITNFDCNNVGENTVALTVTDIGGNTTTTTAIVTVEDNILPSYDNCPSNMVLPFCNPVAIFDISVVDNCPSDVPIIQTSGLPSGSTFPSGEITTQTYEATDAGSNTVVCSFEITVAEAIAFNPTIEDVSCFGEADGSIAPNVSGGSPGYTYLWDDASTGPSLNNLGPGIFTLSVTDDAGCESVQTFEVEEPTDLVTTLVNIINETNSAQNGSVEVTVSGGVMPYTYQWTDLNNNVVGTMEDISGLAAGTYQLFVTDANGCITSSAYTIQSMNPTNNPELDARIKIFPNPTNDWVTIELTDLPITEMDVTIHDVIGQLVSHHPKAKINGGKYLLDMGHFPEGVYLLKLNLKGEIVTKRIVRVD